MNKRIFCLPLSLLFIVTGIVSAQNKSAGINLSVWKGISTQPADSAQTTYFNLGILSTMNRLNGVGFNAFGSVIGGNMNGIQFSGLANMVVEVCAAYNYRVLVTSTETIWWDYLPLDLSTLQAINRKASYYPE